MDKKLISIGDTAKLLGVSIDTVRRWEMKGILRAFRPSPESKRYFRRTDLDAFLEKEGRPLKGEFVDQAAQWAGGPSPVEIPPERYCQTSDVFNARLENFGNELGRSSAAKDIFPLVVAVAGEIGNNSFNHNLGNWPDMPGAFFGYDLQEGRLALADRGQGVYQTLKRVLPELKDEKEALAAAFTRYVSGRAPENRGNGLKFVKDVVLGNPLQLRFQTGRAELALGRETGRLEIRDAAVSIRGCLAELTFPA